MAIAAFKSRDFQTHSELTKFVQTGPVAAVVSIVFNSVSGRFVLFYT